MAGAAGVESTVEFCPGLTIGDLPTALTLAKHVGRQNFGLLIDTMHTIRSGSSPADLAAVDPGLIRYVQVCDALLVPTIPSHWEEAMYERMEPGTGELPPLEILSALPRDLVFSLETPMRSKAEAGFGPRERLAPCVEALRDLLAQRDSGAKR